MDPIQDVFDADRVQRLEELSRFMPQLIWSADKCGTIEYRNQRSYESLSIDPGSPADRIFETAIHLDDLQGCLTAWQQSIATGDPFEHKHRLMQRSGEYRWYLARAVSVCDPAGSIVRWIGTSTDVHEIKRAKDARRMGEEKYHRLIDLTETAYVIADTGGRVLDANDEYVRLTGHREFSEIKGRHVTEWTAPADVARYAGSIKQCMTRENVRHLEVDYISDTGKITPVDVNASVFNAEGGTVYMALCRDISERRKTQEDVQRQQAQISHLSRVNTMGQLATGLAHELNQPLGAILNYAGVCREMLAEKLTPDAQQIAAQALAEIALESQRAGEIIRRLRNLIRKDEPRGAAMDVNHEISEVVRLMAFDLRGRGVSADFQFDPTLPPVWADAIEVQQVVVNLLRNAADALSEHPGKRQILIQTVAEDQQAVVRVTDNGSGIAADKIESIFDPFYSTKSNGLGLGLSICRSIIEMHRGRLKAESSPGRTTFSFTLPFAKGKKLNGILTQSEAA